MTDTPSADPTWQEWLDHQSGGLAYFARQVASGLPAEPYTGEGLAVAETALLERYPSAEAADADDSLEADRCFDSTQRFIAETFVRSFEGRLAPAPASTPNDPEPLVWLPFTDVPIEPYTLIAYALDRRTGTEWARVHDTMAEPYAAWVERGRPPLERFIADWWEAPERRG